MKNRKRFRDLTAEEKIERYKKVAQFSTFVYNVSIVAAVFNLAISTKALIDVMPKEDITESLKYLKNRDGYQEFIDRKTLDSYYEMVEGDITFEEHADYSVWLHTDEGFEEYLKAIEDPFYKQKVDEYYKRMDIVEDIKLRRDLIQCTACAGLIDSAIARTVFTRAISKTKDKKKTKEKEDENGA